MRPAVTATDPVGDIHAHAPPLSQVKAELKLEHVAAPVTNATYINPLPDVTRWERTDQGVDAAMNLGAPILAPCRIKILDIEPGWYAGQPLVYFELLEGADAGQVAVRGRADHQHRAARARSWSRGRRSPATPRPAPRSSTAGRR